jgi:hypothetical protein
LPVYKNTMKKIILRNGHLTLEGDETTEDLRTALLNLRKHTYSKCHRPGLGTPIESLLPNVSVLAVSRTRTQNVKTVATSKERL